MPVIKSVEEIRECLMPLFKEQTLRLALLFGSSATGKTHKRSDIDIAFLYDGPVDVIDLANRVTRLLHTNSVDVVDLGRASPLMKFAAVRNSKLLYEKRPGTFNEFASLAFRRYADTKKLRDARALSIRLFLDKRGLA